MSTENSTQGYTQKYLRQRNFLLVMPILVAPLITFLLWSTGIVGNTKKDDNALHKSNGLNMTLPSASTAKDSSYNKLNFYEAADKEAARRAALAKSDPYYQLSPLHDEEVIDTNLLPVSTKRKDGYEAATDLPAKYLAHGNTNQDANEAKVYQKLNELNRALAENDGKEKDQKQTTTEDMPNDISRNDNEINKLEAMMKQLDASGSGSNPEMEQINAMLEKVLDIQHPERVKEKFSSQVPTIKQTRYAVDVPNSELAVSTLQTQVQETTGDSTIVQNDNVDNSNSNRFYSLDDDLPTENKQASLIEAVIPESGTFVSGSIVKLQLLNDITIKNVLVPRGTFVYGESTLSNERLKINITSVKCQNEIVPVALSVFDQDGLEGIYTPGSITRDVAKQSSDQSLQGVSLASLDNSLGGQAASAGIQAAKSLISKKTKLIRVNISAGYQVILRETK